MLTIALFKFQCMYNAFFICKNSKLSNPLDILCYSVASFLNCPISYFKQIFQIIYTIHQYFFKKYNNTFHKTFKKFLNKFSNKNTTFLHF